MTREALFEQIRKKRTFLCVGLDSEVAKLPKHLPQDAEGLWLFNKAIIDATAPYAVAFKPNSAFYEALGAEGVGVLEQSIHYIKECYPEMFVILDAKRGDIGNTASLYAQSAFLQLGSDAVTVSPYMGEDSVAPFLSYEGKWAIVLALTSNAGALDFQHLPIEGADSLYLEVLTKVSHWGTSDQIMFVAGATQARLFERIRKVVPEHFLLVPGVGAQGGSLREVVEFGMNDHCDLLVNASRSIIFANAGEDFACAAGAEAERLSAEMAGHLRERGLL